MPHHFTTLSLAGAFLVLALSAGPVVADDVYGFQHDNVLGTSLEIQVRADSESAARAAETRILNEIDRLARILSSYDSTSELRRWTASPGISAAVSPELLEVLQLCDHWREASGGAFQPGVESLTRLWRHCAEEDRLPTAGELDTARRLAAKAAWSLDPASGTARIESRTPLTLDALAKGYVIDRAVDAGLAEEAVGGLLVNIGGDLRVAGDMTSLVGIADPRDDSETTPPVTKIRLASRAIATSGNYQRALTIGSRAYSHIIDPRSGQPVDHVISASVTAPRAADADALATICSVLPVEESLALIDSLSETECLLVQRDGSLSFSRGWDRQRTGLFQLTAYGQEKGEERPKEDDSKAKPKSVEAAPAKAWLPNHEVQIDFEVAQPNNSRRYCRPYVAIWVEDPDGFPVRTLTLWVWTSGPGPRWIPDLRRWYRSDQFRLLVDDTDMVETVSRATRPPGKYKVVWDGKDDHGKPVAAGKYTFFIEAAREHGTYQVISKTLTIADKAFNEKLPGNVEIKSAAIEYRSKPAKK